MTAQKAATCPRECSEHHTFEPPCLLAVQHTDWTADPAGRSNSSPLFLAICAEVERIIRSDAHMLIAGNAGSTARLIVANLAHRFGMVPSNASED